MMLSDKMHTLQLMVEQQSRVVEELRSSLARSHSKKVRTKLDAALKSLQDLNLQMCTKLESLPESELPKNLSVILITPTPELCSFLPNLENRTNCSPVCCPKALGSYRTSRPSTWSGAKA